MKKFFVKIMLTLSLILFFAGNMDVFAQEETDDFASGIIVSVNGANMTVQEIMYDEDTGEEIYSETQYTIAPDVELENIGSIAALEEGRDVDVTYTKDGEGRKVSYIYVYDED